MKKIFSFLIMPIFAVMLLCGCDKNASIEKVQSAYTGMKNSLVVDGVNNFFANEENPNAISIAYSSQVEEAINNTSVVNDVQKRYNS